MQNQPYSNHQRIEHPSLLIGRSVWMGNSADVTLKPLEAGFAQILCYQVPLSDTDYHSGLSGNVFFKPVARRGNGLRMRQDHRGAQGWRGCWVVGGAGGDYGFGCWGAGAMKKHDAKGGAACLVLPSSAGLVVYGSRSVSVLCLYGGAAASAAAGRETPAGVRIVQPWRALPSAGRCARSGPSSSRPSSWVAWVLGGRGGARDQPMRVGAGRRQVASPRPRCAMLRGRGRGRPGPLALWWAGAQDSTGLATAGNHSRNRELALKQGFNDFKSSKLSTGHARLLH